MRYEDIAGRVAEIKKLFDDGDNEMAHLAEDDLWKDVLTEIDNGVTKPDEWAHAALKTLDIEEERWYA